MRGSIPAPGQATQRYGGNTPCVEIRAGEEIFIFDLGTGVRALGDHIRSSKLPVRASIFVSHYHYDHLQGLPFFTPIFDAKNSFTFYGPAMNGTTIKQAVSGQMAQPYFPVTAEMVFRAKLDFKEMSGGFSQKIGEATVSAVDLNHPGGTMGYRVDFKGRSVVYATDVEHGTPMDARLFEFARGADIFICDAMYTEDEYFGRGGPPKTGWGHSTWNAACETADKAEVKKLVLFHHDPMRDDREMDRLLRDARKLRPEAIAAKEAMVLKVV